MKSDLHNVTVRKNSEPSGESRAFVQLEMARLRCESLMAGGGQGDQLMAIHREIGLAGYVTCEHFDADHRRECLARAALGLVEDRVAGGAPSGAAPSAVGRTLARMFAETIAASDALAAELAGHDVAEDQRDRLHLVHAHVMSACELLDERLTVLELTASGLDAPI
jgi:hypothetical protein